MIKFNGRYFVWAFVLLIVEILIALFVRDRIVRPYVGDFLVVILMYCFIKSFFDLPVVATALGVLAFSFIIELMQYLNMAERIGLGKSRLAKILLGYSFEWIDLLCYT